jgi:hypothetical protein
MGDPSDFRTERAPSPLQEARKRARIRQRQALAIQHERFLEKTLGKVLPAGPTRAAIVVTIVQALGAKNLAIRKTPKV